MKYEFLSRMRQLKRLARVSITLLALWMPMSLFAQPGFASLEEQMTGEEFQSAGLEKLSAEELAALNSWIRSRSLATLDAPRYGATATMSGTALSPEEISEMKRETIITRINGTFTGWDGQTVFPLENGMIWVQDNKDKYYTEEMINPGVTIEPSMFGGWRLSVEGHDEDCKVIRIQ